VIQVVENNSQKNILQELGPLPYALFKTVDVAKKAFYDSIEEYRIFSKNSNLSNAQIAGQSTKIFAEELMKKYNFSVDDMVNSLPEQYRPYAKIMAGMKWPDAVNFLAAAAKEFGKIEGDGGSYLNVAEVFDKIKTKAIIHFAKYALTH
jgi:hypothetical protein